MSDAAFRLHQPTRGPDQGVWARVRPAISLLVASLVLGTAAAAPSAADVYEIDADHTEVRFTWDHLGVSRQGGRFNSVFGQLRFDPENPAVSSLEVSIPVSGLSTGVAKLDEQLLKTRDYFDVTAYPNITFKSTGIALKSDRTADVTGELSMNGITRPVVLDVIWNYSGPHPLESFNPAFAGKYVSGFSATTQIRRGDWGITRGAPLVSDEIRIAIESEFIRVFAPVAADEAATIPDGGPGGTDPAGGGLSPGPGDTLLPDR